VIVTVRAAGLGAVVADVLLAVGAAGRGVVVGVDSPVVSAAGGSAVAAAHDAAIVANNRYEVIRPRPLITLPSSAASLVQRGYMDNR